VTESTGAASLLGSLPVQGVDRIVRRTLVSAAVASVLGAAVAALVGYPLLAPGLALGFAMAVANHRVFQASALRFIEPEGTVRRKPFAGAVLLRLGVCTAVAIGFLVLVRPVGWGIIAGLALFQASMLVNAIVALIGFQREGGGLGA
jgi:hypothetical protein